MEILRSSFLLGGRRLETALKGELTKMLDTCNLNLKIDKLLKGTHSPKKNKSKVQCLNYYLVSNGLPLTVEVFIGWVRLGSRQLTQIDYVLHDRLTTLDCPADFLNC